MRFCSFASGSSGNCEYIGAGDTNILLDAGISTKRITNGLDAIGVDPYTLDGILITHEHSDHISGLYVYAGHYKVPIYATQGTLKYIEMNDRNKKIDTSLFRVIKPDVEFAVNDILVTPFSTYHDAYDPVGFTFRHGGKKLGVATDLGTYDDHIVSMLEGSDMLFVEANYDVAMLQTGRYPFYLKRRILGDRGHLSNDMSAHLILQLISEKLEKVYLAHLSKENNYPDLAYATVEYELKKEYGESTSFALGIAARDDMSCETLI